MGDPGARGSHPGRVRLDRRAPQLPHRPRVRPPRRGPRRALLAARPPADGQGHPQVPRGDLAGHADGCRSAAPSARFRPRMAPGRWRKDVEIKAIINFFNMFYPYYLII